MKTRYLSILLAGTAAATALGFMRHARDNSLVVHEWGTFTSLQGSDGVPIKWNPLASSQLPSFVYDWNRAGFGRYPSGMLALGRKSALVTYQRMETPVVYFYTPKTTTIDLTVRFPKGGITEWYPQAAEVGPSCYLESPALARLDAGLHSCGVAPTFTLNSLFDFRNVKESLIRWPKVKILPTAGSVETAATLPADSSGSHYFAARETESAFVEIPQTSATNSPSEHERFLFYRGVGNFLTPLSVKMEDEGTVKLRNQGNETITHAFILEIYGEHGTFVHLDNLKPGALKEASVEMHRMGQTLAETRKQLKLAMEKALISDGLYPREAAAMVKTWDDSWFSENGVRVLYLLPRAWTDDVLPMNIEPKPSQIVRVMVGRAELVTPQTERELRLEVTQAKTDESAAQAQVRLTAAKLGRFAQPVFERAVEQAKLEPADRDRLQGLLYRSLTASKP